MPGGTTFYYRIVAEDGYGNLFTGVGGGRGTGLRPLGTGCAGVG